MPNDAELTIKLYSDEYQPQVKALVIAVHEEFGQAYNSGLDYDLDDPSRWYTERGGVFYVLLHSETVVGTAAVRVLGPWSAELKRMYLAPTYRGHGWGSKLLGKCLEFCAARGFKAIQLDTQIGQVAAWSLYYKYGFRTYAQQSTMLLMRRQLC